MKTILQNYIQTVLDQVEKTTKSYQLNVDDDISSLETALTQEITSMYAQITERLDRLRQNVLDLGEGPSSQ